VTIARLAALTDPGGEARVVLGAQAIQRPGYARRGIGRYAVAYANALCSQHPDRVAAIEIDPRMPHPFERQPVACPILSATEFGSAPRASGPLVYHMLSPFQRRPLRSIWPRWASSPNVALAVTIYDLIPWRFRERYLRDSAEHANYMRQLSVVHLADALLAISDASAADLVELLGIDERRVHVIGAAAPEVRRLSSLPSNTGDPDEAVKRVRPGAVLFVSGDDERKNTNRLIDAYSRLAPELRSAHQLVIVGKFSKGSVKRHRERADAGGASRHVVLTGEISDEALGQIMSHTSIAVFPSLAEGFGLPVLEALNAGLPVLVSDIPPLRELVPDAEARFDPHSTDAIRAALERGLSDTAFRERLRRSAPTWAAPFSWDRVADRGVIAYDAALSERARRRRHRMVQRSDGRPHLQMITPLPPSKTGVATYSMRLIDALARHVNVDVYRDDDSHGNPFAARAAVQCRPARGFEWRRELASSSLPPLYCIGNSKFHAHAWAGLMRTGGDVLLHDVRLVGFYRWLGANGLLGEQDLAARMRLAEGQTLDAMGEDIYMVGEIVDHARRVYVHTETAREMVLRKRPGRADDVIVVPFAMPPARPGKPRESTSPIVAAFGHLHQGNLLLDSATELLKRRPDVNVRVLGAGIRPGEVAELRRIAAARGVGARLAFLDWVDNDEYYRWLGEATVAMQLRGYSQGEMSASVADCLSSGLPTVVNDFGPMAELPADVVVRVRKHPSAHEVADAVVSLLDDADRRASLSAAALGYTEAKDCELAARALLDLIRS
jgi:glycosyltransferase involved in cell wall biosynthesis